MKSLSFLILFLVVLVPGRVAADVVFANKDLTASVIEPGVTVLETSDKTTLYLVEGDTAAVLIDTGTEIDGLDKIIGRLTDKPFKVLATHGHYDHVGNIRYFPEVYLHEADFDLDVAPLKEYRGKLVALREGDVFELGGRRLEVVHTPGHTPGSVVFVDYDNGMAFTGDAFGSGQLWMQLQPQVAFSTLIDSCGKMIEIMAEKNVDKLYVGHYPYLKRPLGIDYLIDTDINARRIDAGDTSGSRPFGADALVSANGGSEIVYLPEVSGRRSLRRQRLVLKLDDVHYGEDGDALPPRWERLIAYLKENGIRANLGIIGYSLAGDRQDYFNRLRELAATDGIEFWSHGYHNRMGLDEPGEFEGDFEQQRLALHLTDSLAQAKAGIRLRAWGQHWTNCNEYTDSALATVKTLEMVFGHPTLHTGKHFKGKVLRRNLEMEYPYHNPVYSKFIVNYLGKWRKLDHFYLQGHPNGWDDDRWVEFTRIIDRLRADGVEFVNISQLLD